MTAKRAGRGRPKGSSNAEAQIMAYAGQAFAEYGYHACTVEHILEVSGVSRTNFYRFFKNKEAVYEKIMQRCLEALLLVMDSAMTSISQQDSLPQQLEMMLDAYLNAVFSTGDLLPVLFAEQQSTPSHRCMRDTVLKRLKQHINKLTVATGYSKPDPLLLDGALAAIDRMVYVESLKKGATVKKIQRVKQAALKFNRLLIEEKLTDQGEQYGICTRATTGKNGELG